MTRTLTTAAASLASILALAACAGSPPPDPRIADLQSRIDQARADTTIGRYSEAELRDAQQSANQAKKDFGNGNHVALDHDIYMGQRQVDLARAHADAQALRAQSESVAENVRKRPREVVAPGTFTLTDVLFEPGKATLRPGASNRLNELATYLRNNPEVNATVEGFTDSTGSRQTNERLSKARAEAVRQFLISAGIPSNRVVARGLGESYPIASNTTAAGRQQNRRVEVVLKQA